MVKKKCANCDFYDTICKRCKHKNWEFKDWYAGSIPSNLPVCKGYAFVKRKSREQLLSEFKGFKRDAHYDYKMRCSNERAFARMNREAEHR